mmetsp:Transcript_17318/g.12318  ORF Transcript_17318/g.12318 Transcript_17318/m.12318 type:complete len:120 (+) Transcript_17318:310-669(+)
MLFNFAVEVPNDIIYPIYMKYVQLYGKSANELERKAAVKVLGQICDSDGCLDPIKDEIEDITNFLVSFMNDQSVIVRESAAQVVGMFSENCVPDFLDQHEKMMPCILNSLKQLSQSQCQ